MGPPRIVNILNETFTYYRPNDFRGPHWVSTIGFDYPQMRRSLSNVGATWSGLARTNLPPDGTSIAPPPFMTPSGDLLQHDDAKPGCFSVPFWKALGLPCHDCPFRSDCSAGVDYRLQFGGRNQFNHARASFQHPKWKSVLEKTPPPKLDDLMRANDQFAQLVWVYIAYWWLSDKAVHTQSKALRKLERERVSQARRKAKATAKAKLEAEKQQRLDDMEGDLFVAIVRAIAAGDLELIDTSIRSHIESDRSNTWNRQISQIPNASAEYLSNSCLAHLRSLNPEFESIGNSITSPIDILELVALGGDEDLDGHEDALAKLSWPPENEARRSAVRRRAGMIKKLEETGWVPPKLSFE